MPFNGFISYSHAADNQLAPAIQRGLHRLAKPWHRRRALWIFRDQTGLAVTPALWSSIQNALDGSDYFVLLASPEAAHSPWVNREIEHWMTTKSPGKILPVVTDGEWRWDPWQRDFSEDSTAVPPALRGAFTEEPLYLDLRWARDDRHLSLRHSRFRDAIAQLAAPMHGVSKDDLEGEDVRQHRRVRRLRSGALATLVLLTFVAVLTGVLAMHNAQRANAAAHEARVQQKSAAEQHSNAERSAHDAKTQQSLAADQMARAQAAYAETQRQEKLAGEQRALAAVASSEADKQQQLAADQKALAAQAKADASREQKNAKQQRRLADRAAVRAAKQQALAEQQRALAIRWAAEAKHEQELAHQAAAEATAQQAKADEQTRITVGRRLINQAKATVDDDPQQALMLGAAADKIQNDAESRRGLAGLVTSTRYAGAIKGADSATFGTGDIVAARTDDDVVSLWNVTDRGRPAKLATLGGTARYLAFSPDGKILLTASRTGAGSLWNVADPSHPVRAGELPELGYTEPMTFTPDGRTLATYVSAFPAPPDQPGSSYELRLFDVSDPSRPRTVSTRPLAGPVEQIEFSPDGHTMVLSGDSVAVYDVTDPTDLRQVAGLGEMSEPAIAFSTDRATLAVAADTDGTVNLWNLTDPSQPELSGSLKASAWVNDLAFQPGKNTLLTSTAEGRLTAWDIAAVTSPSRLGDVPVGSEPVVAVEFSADGRTLITTGGESADLWNAADFGAPVPQAMFSNHAGYQRAAAFGPDGRSLATVDVNGTASFWDVTNPARPRHQAAVDVAGNPIYAAAFSADRRTVATGGTDNRLTVTDLTDPSHPVTLADLLVDMDGVAPPERFQAMTFSPDGRTLAVVTSYGRVMLYDLADRARPRRVYVQNLGQFDSLAFSPDGHTLAAGDGSGRVELWDVTSPAAPARVAVLPHYGASTGAPAVSFSPDGHTLVARGSNDKSAALWDVTDRAHPSRLSTLTGDSAGLTVAVFAPDGRTLATESEDHVVALWDITDPSAPVRIATLRGGSLAGGLALSPDGHTLATGVTATSEDLTLWDYSDLNRIRSRSAEQACAMTGRGLTPSEWDRYIPNVPYQPTCRK